MSDLRAQLQSTLGDAYTIEMPFVKGESLRARIANGIPITLTEATSILRDVARALAYAHAEGVVHRDIKPENILLSNGTAVVTDFGIAKALSASRTHDGHTDAATGTSLTQAGGSIGTPAYMAPEQTIGADVEHRADIHACGVVAYEALAGAHPFAGKSNTAQMIVAHLSETPMSLSTRNGERTGRRAGAARGRAVSWPCGVMKSSDRAVSWRWGRQSKT